MSNELRRMFDDREYHFGKRTDRTYVSKRFKSYEGPEREGRDMRIVTKVIDSADGIAEVSKGDQTLLRRTPAGRQEIKATIFEDDRSIRTLTIQKFNSKSGPSDHYYFSFVGREITKLLELLVAVNRLELPNDRKFHISDDALRELILNEGQALRIFREHEEIFLDIAKNERLKRDLVAIGRSESRACLASIF